MLELLQKADKNLAVAEHMIGVTYPLLQEPKLLLNILDNIFMVYANGITALLEFEKDTKRRDNYPTLFQDKFDIFRRECVDTYHIPKEHLEIIQELKELVIWHKRSPVEFHRKKELIMCSDEYELKKLSVKKMNSYITKAKIFIQTVRKVVE